MEVDIPLAARPQVWAASRATLKSERWPVVALLLITAAAYAAALYVQIYSYLEWKMTHALIFFIWSLCFSAMWRRTLRLPGLHAAEVLIPLCAAGFAEIVQIWIPRHACNWDGLCASFCGVVLAGMWLHTRTERERTGFKKVNRSPGILNS